MFCEACGAPGAKFSCGRCSEAYYCNSACQKEAWKMGHKLKCVKNAANAAKAPGATALAPTAAAAPRSGGGNEEECAICLEALQQPQTMPCGHRFCRGCVTSMQRHGAAVAQVCPLCRGAMPDAERLRGGGVPPHTARAVDEGQAWWRAAAGGGARAVGQGGGAVP